MQLDRIALEASVCRDSFSDFVKRFWSVVVAEKLVWNWHMDVLCDELQIMAERVFDRKPKLYDLIVNIPPGTSKSVIASIMFPVWVWTNDKTLKTICGSYAHTLALDLSWKSRDVAQSEKFRQLYGDVELREDVNTKGHFVNKAGGGRMAVGTGGAITGFHGHFQIVDDPLSPERAASDKELKTAIRWMSKTLSSRKIDKRVTPLILIMQRLHVNDPTGHLLVKKKDGVRHICLPGELTEDVRPRCLRKKYIDGLLDPVRMSHEALEDLRIDQGDAEYQGQVLQKPVPPGGTMFKLDNIEVVEGTKRPHTIVRYWDKAGTGGAGAYTVGVKMGKLGIGRETRFVIMDVKRGQWEAYERENIIKQTAVADGKSILIGVEQEPGSGGKESAQATVRNLAGWRVVMDRPSGDKTLRADPFAVQVNGGNVVLLNGEWVEIFLNELQHFPASKFKDQVDGCSGAFKLLNAAKRKVGALQ